MSRELSLIACFISIPVIFSGEATSVAMSP
jgi:hypothetical protein